MSFSSALNTRRVLVTGSTSGIGLGIATMFAKSGCEIILSGMGKQDEIDALKADLEDRVSHSPPIH